MDKLYVDDTQYRQLITQVFRLVEASDYQPDMILGVSRGGLFLADGLSRFFRRPMAVVAASSYRDVGGMVQGQLQLSASIASVVPVAGKVLLVDDLADSGQTLQALCAHLRFICPCIEQLKTAVIWVKSSSVFQPDFAAEKLESDVWVVQPFEMQDHSII